MFEIQIFPEDMNENCILGLKTSVLVRAYDSGRPLTVSSCDLHSPMFEQGPWDTVWASAAIDIVANFCAVSEAMGGGGWEEKNQWIGGGGGR